MHFFSLSMSVCRVCLREVLDPISTCNDMNEARNNLETSGFTTLFEN